MEWAALERMHEQLCEMTLVDAIYVCPHDNHDQCVCRKPSPGLLLRAAEEWGIPLTLSYLVGDTWKDIAAGNSAGCKTFLVDSPLKSGEQMKPSFRVHDLPDAVAVIAELHAQLANLRAVPTL